MASFLIGLTPAHFFALAAIIILTLLVGALCNQRLTRQRWQAIRDELQEQHQLQLTEANAILEHTQLQLDEYRDEVNFFGNGWNSAPLNLDGRNLRLIVSPNLKTI